MGFIIGLLTFVLVLDCVALILLVLIQLPKKEAGLGLAFGGGAADALFGAGSGTVLTKATKYAAGIFFGLAIFLGVVQGRYFRSSSISSFEKGVQQQSGGSGAALPPVGLPEAPAPAGGTTAPTTPAPKSATTPEAATPPVTTAPSTPAPFPATPAPANPTPPK